MSAKSENSIDTALQPFFDQSLDCLCITNYEGYFVKINPAFIKLLGYPEETLKKNPVVDFIHPKDRDITARHREKLLKKTPLINFENRYVCRSGEIIWLHWTSIALIDKDLIYAIAKNVTYKKKLEKDRILNIRRLSLINEHLKKQNYVTCHDLRAPLNNLLSLLHLIDRSMVHGRETQEIIDLIHQSANGLEHTLNSYLDSFKASEEINQKLEDVDFEKTLSKVTKSISTLIKSSGTRVHTDFSSLKTVKFKSTYLESILLNLITNSIKYARPKVGCKITIKTDVRHGFKRMVFSDNGLGFDMEKVGHLIFKLNERFHENKDSKGIGLYLVYNQVTSLGGNIDVRSRVNNGTTFTITFKS